MKRYQKKMKALPPCSISDKGYRSKENQKIAEELEYAFFGKLEDVPEEKKEFCKSARSATEGLIAVAKNLRGMRKSLYKGIQGDQIWVALGQAAYNLKKFYQLYHDELLEEETLEKLGFFT